MAGIVIRSLMTHPRDRRSLPAPRRIRSRIQALSRCRPRPEATNPGDSSGEAIPVPIPNTEVKLSSAEDTERAAFRENRSSPGFLLPAARDRRAGLKTVRTGILMSSMVEPSEPNLVVPSPRAPASKAICPFLLAADGQWRSSSPAREHRCTAVAPPSILAADKQRRLCLTTDHDGCATYLVATGHAGREAGSLQPSHRVTRSSGRDFVRTAPLVLDHGRLPVSVAAVAAERGLGQVALLGLLAIAFAAILIARLSSGSGDRGGIVTGSSTPEPGVVVAEPSSSTTPLPTAAGSAVPSPSQPQASVTPAASATPVATSRSTYKVRSGDTLSGIAATFGTTVDVLTQLNDIKDASSLRIGQVLQLP